MAETYIEKLIEKYAEQIELVKSLIAGAASEDDAVIALSLDKAQKAIMQYTLWAAFDEEYISALIALAIQYLNNDKTRAKAANGERSVSMQTQGSRTVSYTSPVIEFSKDGLSEDVRAMLPRPKLRVL
ncbi:hypothetical protein SDC9_136333 [bioreactor metagenome]|uniref:Phage gp6-like head-tail connector protein n=1 Tax=bioreactor metagenome TaxID=1076179 RepID=A0A645DJ04_9ZZZZ